MSAHHLSNTPSLRQYFKQLDKLTIQQKLGRGIYQKGQDYYENNAVEELEVSDTKIVVQKGKDKWELARTPETKITGDLKVGSKVTIEYTMTAKSVDAKADKGKKK